MKKIIKLSLLTALLIGGATIVYAKNQQRNVKRAWMCTPATTGQCMADFTDPGNYDCITFPEPITWGDCGGIVEVVIPDQP